MEVVTILHSDHIIVNRKEYQKSNEVSILLLDDKLKRENDLGGLKMKKTILYPLLLLLLLGLSVTACSGTEQTDNSSKESHSVNQSISSSSSSKKTETESSTKKNSDAQTSSSESMVKTDNNPQENQAQAVLKQLNAFFPNNSLPQAILTSSTPGYLSAATTKTSEQANFRILYYAEDHSIAVNDIALNELQPIALFEKKSFDSTETAVAEVNQIIDTGGNKVDLGYGITGYQQGAAGSSYLSWQEGNWGMVVRASNIEGEDAQPLAKEIVTYLETAMLPAPQNVGQISLSTGEENNYQINSVSWQNGSVVYKIQHFDAIQAVKMAVSTNN